MIKKLQKNETLAFFFVLGILAIFLYKDLGNTFYQQDEWMVIGQFFGGGFNTFVDKYSVFQLLAGQQRILGTVVSTLFFNILAFNIPAIALFSLILHVLNSILVYFLAKKISSNSTVAFFAGIFFLVASAGQQAVLWFAASNTALPSAFFTLLSLITYFSFLENNKKSYLFISFLFGLIACLFKESAFILFLLFPVLFLLIKKASIITTAKLHSYIIAYVVFMIVARIIGLLSTATDTTNAFNAYNFPTPFRIFSHLISYPIEGIAQIFIDPNILFGISGIFFKSVSTDSNFIRTTGAEIISVICSAIIIFLVGWVAVKKRKFRSAILFGLSFTIIQFIPFVVLTKGSAYLESRYYYPSIIGASIIFGVLFEYLKEIFYSSKSFIARSILATLLFFLVMLLFKQIFIVKDNVDRNVLLGSQTKTFLSQLSQNIPAIPAKPVFYVTGNKDFYLPKLPLPLQQGPGYTLMVWYYSSGNIPGKLLREGFLWGIYEEGYKEAEGKGFGYFWKKQSLEEAIKINNIKKEQLVGVNYLGNEQKIINITEELKKELYK